MDKSYTLQELNEYIRRVLALNFAQPVWVLAEIAQINHSRGHYFLTLVEKEALGETLAAQSEAVIWERTFRRLRRSNGTILTDVLRTGLMVKFRVRVDFNERYGLKLIVEDLDPAFTMGELELQKRAALERLEREGLLTLNRQLSLPPVLQRIAVLSSPDAAGYQDFIKQLEQNTYGYAFRSQLFPIAVQGQQVLPDLQRQLKQIGRRQSEYDCVVLIRGGGGRTDLAAFDQYAVGAELARCPLPLFTGIGHDIDETTADRVSHLALKTPTAVAEFLVQRSLAFENHLHHLAGQIQNLGLYQVQAGELGLSKMKQNLFFLCREQLRQSQNRIRYLQEQIPHLLQYHLEKKQRHFEQLQASIQLLDPENLLRRGYSLTYRNGQLIRSAADLQAGDNLLIRLADGEVHAVVNRTNGRTKGSRPPSS